MLDKDPHNNIEVGTLIDNKQTIIIGFSNPAGNAIDKLMVNIKYECGSETTRKYSNVLFQNNICPHCGNGILEPTQATDYSVAKMQCNMCDSTYII